MGERAEKANANRHVAQQHQRRPLLCEILRSDKQTPEVPPNHLAALCLSELFRVQAIQRGIIFQQKSASKSAANRMPSTTHTFFFHFKLADWRVKVVARFMRKTICQFFISRRSGSD